MGTFRANERHWFKLHYHQYSKRTILLKQRTRLCDLMLLQCHPVLESSVTESPAAMGTIKFLRDFGEGSTRTKGSKRSHDGRRYSNH